MRGKYKCGRIIQEPAARPKILLPSASAQLLLCCLDVFHEACRGNQISFVRESCVTEDERNIQRIHNAQSSHMKMFVNPKNGHVYVMVTAETFLGFICE